MNDTRQNLHDDKIDIRDFIKVTWDNKTNIVVGTVIAVLLGIGMNLICPDIYRASMVVTPGILGVDATNQKTIYIDSPENIMAAIQFGSFDSEIEKILSKDAPGVKAADISYAVEYTDNTDLLKVSTDYTSKEVATKILIALSQLLKEEYRHKSDLYKASFRREIEILQNQIKQKEIEVQRGQNYISQSEARIEELSDDLKTLIQHNKRLSEEKAIIQSNGNEELNRSNFNITQNMAVIDDLKEAIHRHQVSRSGEVANLRDIDSTIVALKDERNRKQAAINNVQDIEILQAPVADPIPVKPKKARNIAFAFLIGLFLSIIFVFMKNALQADR